MPDIVPTNAGGAGWEDWLWTAITTTDRKGAIQGANGQLVLPLHARKMIVVVEGTFGTGSPTILIEGSIVRANPDTPVDSDFYQLDMADGNPAQVTAAGMMMILNSTYYVRPRLTGGDGTTDLNVRLMAALPIRR